MRWLVNRQIAFRTYTLDFNNNPALFAKDLHQIKNYFLKNKLKHIFSYHIPEQTASLLVADSVGFKCKSSSTCAASDDNNNGKPRFKHLGLYFMQLVAS
jgi:hypothetical protein